MKVIAEITVIGKREYIAIYSGLITQNPSDLRPVSKIIHKDFY